VAFAGFAALIARQCAAEPLDEATRAAERGDYPAALRIASEACAQRRKSLGERHVDVARCEFQESRHAQRLGRYEESHRLAVRSREVFAETLGVASADYLAARNAEGASLYYLDRFPEMLAIATDAWEGRKAQFGPDHPDSLGSQNTVAVALRNLGRTREAIELYRDLVAKNERRNGATHPGTLRGKANLAAALFVVGEAQASLGVREEIYAARLAARGPAHPETLSALRDVAQAKWAAGQRDEAVALLEKALPAFLANPGPTHPDTLNVRLVLAVFYEGLGRYEENEAILRTVVEARRASLGKTHGATLTATYNLGVTYILQGRGADASGLARATLDELAAGGGKDVGRERDFRRLEGYALLREGRPREALEAFDAAKRPGDPEDPFALQGEALALFATGQRDPALAQIDDILKDRRARLGNDHPRTLDTLGMQAQLLAESGRETEALERLAEVVERSEARAADGLAFNRSGRDQLTQRIGTQFQQAGYKTYARLLATRDADKALEVAELSKARSLGEGLRLEEPPGDAATRKRRRAAAIRLAKAEEGLASAEAGKPAYLEAVAERAAAEAELGAVRSTATRRSAISAQSARVALPADAAFIDFVVDGERIAAIVARRAGAVRGFDLGAIASLGSTVEAARRLASSSDWSQERIWRLPGGGYAWSLARPAPGSERAANPAEVFEMLASRLLAPIAEAVRGAPRWIVSPDGALAFAPFEVLPWEGKALLASREVSYAVSLSAITTARVSPAGGLLAVGIASQAPWADLPSAEEEASRVAALFPAGKARLMLGPAATQAAMADLDADGSLGRFRYVHLATHGILSPRAPSLSSVRFAQGGALTAAELGAYRIGADLVVLSACDTGLGQIVAGEGVVGLPYALALAGARRTMLTLWSVSDASAADFMPSFYRRLVRGMRPAKALRETKLEFANSKGPWSAPRHWAPYVLYGD
jgi:hypothetical protein